MKEIIIKEWRDSLGIKHREDVGKLVRCGNCINSEPNDVCDEEIICRNDGCAWNKNGYCSDGELK